MFITYATGGSISIVAPADAPLRAANQLFLLTAVLCLSLGAVFQSIHAQRGLIATELFLILAPALWFASRTGAPETSLRMRWTGVRPCLLGVAAGAGLLPLAIAAGSAASKVLGYELKMEQFTPHGFHQTAASILATAIWAPVCEEMVFRGYILGAYERAGLRPGAAVLAVAGLFTAWHFSLSRAPGIMPLALALTYTAWKTGSVWPAVGLHFGVNAPAAIMNATSNWPVWDDPRLGRAAFVLGLPLACLCLKSMPDARAAAPAAPGDRPRCAWRPAIAGLLLCLAVMAVEFAIGRFAPHLAPDSFKAVGR